MLSALYKSLATFFVSFVLINPIFSQEKVEYFGWMPHKKSEAQLSKTTLYDKQLENLVRYNDENDAYLYKFLFKALQEHDQLTAEEIRTNRLDSLNQGQVGSCVGYATSRALDVMMAVNAYHRQQLHQIWLSRTHPPAIYAIGRIGHNTGGDGSTGIWSVEGLSQYGSLHRLQYESYDLTSVNALDARTWASRGLPGNLKEDAQTHKLVTYARVSNKEEAKAAIQNGYPIIICAQASYPNSRDANGFSKLNGRQWAHAMCVVAYRGVNSGKEGFLISNSWGNTWNDGPIFPDDMPFGAFWVTPSDLEYHLKQDDSYALTDYNGFQRKKIKWEDVFNFNSEIED